jgi:hypothetical protein
MKALISECFNAEKAEKTGTSDFFTAAKDGRKIGLLSLKTLRLCAFAPLRESFFRIFCAVSRKDAREDKDRMGEGGRNVLHKEGRSPDRPAHSGTMRSDSR